MSHDLGRYPGARPPCHEDCWHYDCFGGKEGCGQHHNGWGGWPEEIEPGQECLYLKKGVFANQF
ncbi:hypothetical protein GF386_02770 [Candidatus Pacearchaeota archaeon]|nr:hypothetical protein [Candidatus Pacearchaeota archaeon]MBD3283071.1 hypothetical protein [Candidatus Pacearchaeota archaeon]